MYPLIEKQRDYSKERNTNAEIIPDQTKGSFLTLPEESVLGVVLLSIAASTPFARFLLSLLLFSHELNRHFLQQ